MVTMTPPGAVAAKFSRWKRGRALNVSGISSGSPPPRPPFASEVLRAALLAWKHQHIESFWRDHLGGKDQLERKFEPLEHPTQPTGRHRAAVLIPQAYSHGLQLQGVPPGRNWRASTVIHLFRYGSLDDCTSLRPRRKMVPAPHKRPAIVVFEQAVDTE